MYSSEDMNCQAKGTEQDQVEKDLPSRKPWRAPVLKEFAVSDTAANMGTSSDIIFS